MSLKLGTVTPEMEQALIEAKRKEDEFFARWGFPEYSTSDAEGRAHPAHRGWVKVAETEGSAYDSPMARKMFVLGWLVARGKLGTSVTMPSAELAKLQAKLKLAEEALEGAMQKARAAAQAFNEIGCTQSYHEREWDSLNAAFEQLRTALAELRKA